MSRTQTLARVISRIEAIKAETINRDIAAELEETGAEAIATAGDYLSGPRLKARTGNLRRSLNHKVATRGVAVDLTLRAGGGTQDVRYAAIHEFGGTIEGNPWLWIPKGAALKASGESRYRSPRDIPGAIIVRGANNPVVVRPVGKKRVEFFGVLVRRVHIREQRYLRDARDKASVGLGQRLADRFVARIAQAYQ